MKFDQHFVQRVLRHFKLADIKQESSEAYLLKLGKNCLSWDFEVIYIFRKNEVLNICRYLKNVHTYTENK